MTRLTKAVDNAPHAQDVAAGVAVGRSVLWLREAAKWFARRKPATHARSVALST